MPKIGLKFNLGRTTTFAFCRLHCGVWLMKLFKKKKKNIWHNIITNLLTPPCISR